MYKQLTSSFPPARVIPPVLLAVVMIGLLPVVGYAHSLTLVAYANDPKNERQTEQPQKTKTATGQPESNPGRAGEPPKAGAQRTLQTRTKGPVPSRNPRTPTPKPPLPSNASKSAAKPGGPDTVRQQPPGASTPIDVASGDSDVPPEEKTYQFSFKDATYEQLVEGFARQTGLGVLGAAPKDGKVNFVTTEKLSFDEALARVRMLLFNYKPHEPYWIERRDTHLAVIRVNDIYRVLPPERMFPSVEVFRAAHLSEDELALVVYTPKSGSIAPLRMVRDFLPDYVRVTPLEDKNAVAIFALVKDIEKYLWLIDFFSRGGSNDPRTLEAIELHHILPSAAVAKLGTLMDLGGGGVSRRRTTAATTRTRGKRISPLDTMREPEVSLLPDDEQGMLIVRAMKDKMEEIKQLLPYVDVDLSGQEPDPVVIEVEHADPAELIDTIQKILAAISRVPEEGPAKKTPPRRATSVRATPGTVSADGITLLVHPSDNAIIVIADDNGVTRVRALVKRFDVPGRIGPVRIPLKYADATDVTTTLGLVLGGSGRSKATPEQVQLVPDAANNFIWFTGTEKDLVKVRELVAVLDAPEQGVSLHIFRLRHQQPSFVANILREYDRGAATPAPGTKSARAQRARTITVSKFTPNDELGRLFVLCTDAEWGQYLPILEELDRAVDERPAFVRLVLEHIDPTAAIDQLGTLLGADPRSATVRYVPTDGGLLVMGASEQQVEDIKTFLTEIDRSVEIEQRTFQLRHRNPSDIKTTLETLVGGDRSGQPARPARRPTAKGSAPAVATVLPQLTIIELGNRLIVRTTPENMVKVAKLIAEFDVKDVGIETRVFQDFPPGVDIEAIADTLAAVLSGSPTPGRQPKGNVRGGSPEGPRFIPQPAAGKLVVIAKPEMFAEIEQLLDVLRTAVEAEPYITEFIGVQFADPAELIELITPLLEMKVRQLIAVGDLRKTGKSVGGPVTPQTARPGRARSTNEYFHIDADVRNSSVVIAAPQVIVNEAQQLVAQFDKPGDQDVLFRTVDLVNADPAAMVKAVREMMGTSTHRVTPQARARGTQGAKPLQPSTLSVVEAPGGRAVCLHGLAEDVEQATEWIEQLDAIATRGRAIKVYKIMHADIVKLAELILNVVDTPPKTGARVPRARRITEPAEDDIFELTKTWTGQNLYMQADLVASTMIVAAPEAKIAEIDAIVSQFDTKEGELEETPVPKFTIALEHQDAFDAVFDLEMLLEAVWDPPNELPRVGSAPFGNVLVVRYPHENRFPEIEELIRKYIDKPNPEDIKLVRRSFQPPPGISAEQAAAWIMMNHPELDIELRNLSTGKQEDYDMERLRPLKRGGANPCILPLALDRMVSTVLSGVLGQQEPPDDDEPDAADKDQQPPPDVEPLDDAEGDDPTDFLRDAAMSLLKPKGGEDKKPPSKDALSTREKGSKLPRGAKLKIGYDAEKGVFVVEGPAGVVEEVDDWLDELKEEIEDLPVPPDIRIYRVRYIDIYSATEILEEMFNATRQQRQFVQQQQRLQQQRLRQQQQQQRQQQQRQQQQGKGPQPGQPQRPGRPGQPGQQPPQVSIPQLPPTTVRVYPNPRDRTLILRADTSQYPAILELLATIDQPQPVNSEFRIFRVEKLNATDVVELLKEMLGLESQRTARAGARTQAQARRPTGSSGPGGGLPRTVMQETVTGAGKLGVDPKDIKLSSNKESNTIVAMAPPVALDFIGDLIKQLESEEVPKRIAKYYELKHADAETIAEYLTTHFEEENAVPRSRERRKNGGTRGRSLNTPSFVPYPRLNLLTVLATAEQINEVDSIIERLDVSYGEGQWTDITLHHADAKLVADTLTKMFSGAAAPGRPRGKGESAGGLEPMFLGDEDGRILFYSAPDNLREQILATIQKLEAEAQDKTKLRVIELLHATPSDIATAIEDAYGRGRGGKGGRGQSGVPFTVTAHDPSKRLFVRADEELFAEIESLAQSLDKPRTVGFEFRIYPLQYANARQVHTQLNKLMTDYLKRLDPTARKSMEAFSVEVDDKANALVVLGSPSVFKFLEENLPKIDNPATKQSPPDLMMVALKNADAQEVAQNITRLWSEKNLPPGEPPPQAEANRSLNVLIVRGTQAQLDEIKKEMVDPLEEQTPPDLLTETFTLKYADPEAVADFINNIFEAKKRAYESLRGRNISPLHFTVVVTPEVSTRQIIVQASEKNMAVVKARIAELDQEDVAGIIATSVKIYPISYADPNAVVKIINEWASARKQSAGRKQGASSRDVVSATAELATQSVVVTASESNHLIIQKLIDELDTTRGDQQEVQVLTLENADADAVARTLTEIFIRSTPRRPDGLGEPISISALQGSKAILVKGKPEDFAEIEAVVAQLDTEDTVIGEEVRVVPLLYGDAAEMQTAIQEYLRKPGGRGGRGGELAGDVRLSVLTQSNALVISGSRQQVDRLESTIRQLDQSGEEGSVPQIIRLEHAEVAEIAPSLQDMFSGQGGRPRGQAPPVIIPNEAANTLLVRAGPTDLTAIRSLVQQLDTEGEKQENFRLLQVASGINVTDLAEKVERSINESARGRGGTGRSRDMANITITPDTRGNALILAGSPSLFDDAEKMVRALEEMGPSGGKGIRIIRLGSVPADEIQRLIDRLRGEPSSSKSGRRPRSTGRRPRPPRTRPEP